MENQIDNFVEEEKKYFKLQQYEKAIECFDKAIKLNPSVSILNGGYYL